jgi:hypothetical protein
VSEDLRNPRPRQDGRDDPRLASRILGVFFVNDTVVVPKPKASDASRRGGGSRNQPFIRVMVVEAQVRDRATSLTSPRRLGRGLHEDLAGRTQDARDFAHRRTISARWRSSAPASRPPTRPSPANPRRSGLPRSSGARRAGR